MTYTFNLISDGHGGFIQKSCQPTMVINRTIPISWENREIITINLIGNYKIEKL